MKPWLIFVIIFVFVLAAGVLCYSLFEIVPSTRRVEPSQEAKSNSFLALDRWLSGTGHPIRVLTGGNLDTLLRSPEKTVYVEDSCFFWTGDIPDGEESGEMISEWIREGGNLVVSLNKSRTDWRLAQYLESLGIESYDFMEELNSGDEGEDPREGTEETAEQEDAANDASSGVAERERPSLDWNISLKVDKTPETDRVRVITTDRKKIIKLVTLYRGKGTITITGTAYFLYSHSLDKQVNAELASALLAEPDTQSGGKGILFIRGIAEERRLFGGLFERGDPRPLIAAALLLIILGFWMVIPSFGRYQPISERPGKPLRERFLAEGQFLKKYGALDKYREAYERELEQHCRARGIEMPARDARDPAKAGNIKTDMRAFMQYQRDVMNMLEEKENHRELS
jgi:hypothetical protein